jgi:acyl-ACP thioesterase
MKIEISRRVDYTDVNPAFRLKLGVMFRYLQAAAVEHSERVGLGTQSLVSGGTVWVLNKISAVIHRYPTYREDIRIVSWHKGKKGLRAYRDFQVFSKEECLAEAASMWVYLDLDQKKLKKIPDEISDAYTVEPDSVDIDVDAWKPEPVSPNKKHTITTRYSDLDPLGHVNNTVYFDFLETIAEKAFAGNTYINAVNILFQKEISENAEPVTVGIQTEGKGGRFRIFRKSTTFALGEMQMGTV